MKRIKQYYGITLLLSVLMMGLIFYFSAENSIRSSALSGGITEKVLHLLQTVFPGGIAEEKWYLFMDNLETIIRKIAHFTEYFFLGMILQSHMHAISRKITLEKAKIQDYRKLIIPGASVAIFYACTDEFHQLFVPGRAGRLFDVMVDSSGVLCGTLVFFLILWPLLDGLIGKG